MRIEVLCAALIRWSYDEWETTNETATYDTGLDMHVADLPTKAMEQGKFLSLFTGLMHSVGKIKIIRLK